MHDKDIFLNTLFTSEIPDLVETLSLCVNAGEADMLLTIALSKFYEGNIPKKYLENRFCYQQPWSFFDKVFNLLSHDKSLSKQLSCMIIGLYEENPFTLSCDDNIKSSPYHAYLDRLSPFFMADGSVITMKNAEFCGIIPSAANVDIDYRKFTTDSELVSEFKALNFRDEPEYARECRLNALTEIKYIKNHPFFPELNGQRGVFAKSIIPAGTVIGYVSGDIKKMGDTMPPMLCSWPMAHYRFKLSFSMLRKFVHTYTNWVDSYILGNRLKLINSCIPHYTGYKTLKHHELPYLGNIGCYFGHFKLDNERLKYLTAPFYIAFRDIAPGEELLTHYGCLNTSK